MVDLETIIALTPMPYIVDLDTSKLHLGDEKVFNDIIARVLHYMHDKGWLLFKLMLIAMYECK